MTVFEPTWPLLVAGALAILLGLAHSVLGERYILVRLFRRDLPKLFGSDWFTKRTLRFAWHLTTLLAIGMGAILIALAGNAGPDATRVAIAVTFLASAALTAGFTNGRHLAWPVMTAIGLLAWPW